MKILNQVVASMYIWSIILLCILAAGSAYVLGVIPYGLLISVILCAFAEIAITTYYLKQKQKVPYSGIITGLIIGLVAPINVAILPLVIASLVAVLSKFFIKVKSINVFNPASFGMLIGLGIFAVGSSWWGTTLNIYGTAITASVILIIAAYLARRLVLSITFVATSVVLSLVSGTSLTLLGLEVALLSVNYFFAFLMLIEPKTSPAGSRAQAAYGIFVALVYFALLLIAGTNLLLGQSAIFIALIIGNLAYAFYRVNGRRIMPHHSHVHHKTDINLTV